MWSDMGPQLGGIPRQRLMENITLQHVLNNIVEDPRENVVRDDEKESWRQLSIESERTIADLLAVLSGAHDDNCKIMAVCIEESRDHDGLTIRMAANTGDCSYVTDGFEEIAKTLETAHRRGIVELLQILSDSLILIVHQQSRRSMTIISPSFDVLYDWTGQKYYVIFVPDMLQGLARPYAGARP